MKTGLSLADLAAEIERQQKSKVDYVLDTRRLSLSTHTDTMKSVILLDNATEAGELGEFAITDHTHGQVAERLGVPKAFYDRLRHGHQPKRGARVKPQTEVFDNLVNGLFQHAPEKRMVRTLDGKARAYMSNRYRPLDNYDLAQVILPIIGEFQTTHDARIESCNITEANLYIKVVLPKIELPDPGLKAKVGDVVQSGFVVQNSEIGLGSLGVFPMIYTLACLNGMTREKEGIRQYHVGRAVDEGVTAYDVYTDATLRADDKAFWMKTRDVVKAAGNQAVFESIVSRMADAANSDPIQDPVGAVERIAGHLSLVEKEQKSVLTHLIEGGDLSAYGVVNAITRTAQDVESYDRASELEKLGGDMLDLSKAQWRELVTVA